MNRPPFDVGDELCQKLEIDQARIRRKRPARRSQSQGPEQHLPQALHPEAYLPGEPRVQLADDDGCITRFLQSELYTNDLNTLAPHLWLVAIQDSAHISPLTEQLARGRQIVVSEDPGRHLVWIYDRVFMKPLPKYLLSHAFWEHYLVTDSSPIEPAARRGLREAATGFLRSYAYLVRRRSDFMIATKGAVPLIPKGISHARFTAFISRFEEVGDDRVLPRYRLGELRLGRLNIWCKVFLRKRKYSQVDWQYGAYIARYYAPLAFLFGILTLFMSAMQVALAVQPLAESGNSWLGFALFSREFALFSIALIVAIVFILFSILALFLRELIFAGKGLTKQRDVKARQLAQMAD